MFNRHLYQKLQTQVQQRNKAIKLQQQYTQRRKTQLQSQVSKYKSKVRNFLVQLASNPIELGQYIPPINNIERAINSDHRLGAPQMFINGWKTNKDRLMRAEEENRILDYSPMKSTLKNQSFRQRSLGKEIQPTLRFAENKSMTLLRSNSTKYVSPYNSKITQDTHSVKNIRLPTIATPNPQKKTYFKAIQQMGNNLKMMQQTSSQRLGLENRLMVVMDGKQAKVKETALDLLVKCKLLKKRVASERFLKTMQAENKSVKL